MNCDMSESRDLSLHRLLPLLEPDKIKTVLFFFCDGSSVAEHCSGFRAGLCEPGQAGKERRRRWSTDTLHSYPTKQHWRAGDIGNTVFLTQGIRAVCCPVTFQTGQVNGVTR